MQLPLVIDTFTRGFSAVRSLTHPYVVERVGPLWVMKDGPRTGKQPPRNSEYVALNTPPDEVVALIKADRPKRYALCVVHPGVQRDMAIEMAYKALGYRLGRSEPFFMCRTSPVKRNGAPMPVRRVTTASAAQAVARAARHRQIDESTANDDAAPARLFAAYDGQAPVGWVTSIRVTPTRAWVANLYVQPEHRGKGVGASLMRAMLRDDARRGVRFSVLTASGAGARLYPRVGYQQVGLLQLFTPRR